MVRIKETCCEMTSWGYIYAVENESPIITNCSFVKNGFSDKRLLLVSSLTLYGWLATEWTAASQPV